MGCYQTKTEAFDKNLESIICETQAAEQMLTTSEHAYLGRLECMLSRLLKHWLEIFATIFFNVQPLERSSIECSYFYL